MSPSALSHTTRSLESRLDLRLLTLTTLSVSPTEAGQRLLATVGPRFGEIETEMAALGDLRDKPAGTIRITTRITTAEHAANRAVEAVKHQFGSAQYPADKIHLDNAGR